MTDNFFKITMPKDEEGVICKSTIDYAISPKEESLFTDEILALLLKKDIEEECKKIKEEMKEEELEKRRGEIDYFISTIDKVIFNKNATIVLWKNGEKTVVKCQKGETFDKEKGLALCIIKYIFGNIGYYNEIFKSFELDKEKTEYSPSVKALYKGYTHFFSKLLK
ncbi:MAG: hypothetical protein J6T10_18605 [Methanobrevibacter sp.]|nr:hypothetical protein [Methanobrevibacter sp.]